MKRYLSVLLAAIISLILLSCGSKQQISSDVQTNGNDAAKTADTSLQEDEKNESDNSNDKEDSFRIGIVTGSLAQSEDDRRGAEAFREKYGEDKVTLAIYPDNFSEELETTVQIIVNLAEDPSMKAIIVNQAVDGTTEAFRRIKEIRPDILCIAGEAYEDFDEIEEVADLVVNSDFVARGYLMIHTANELGCDTFVHISFPRHLSYESVSRQVSVMKAACEEFDLKFVMEEAPDPTTDVGVPGAQQFITEHVPEWIDKYGKNSAYFCTNDAHTEPLIRALIDKGGYFIEADLPSPLMGYPGALDLDLSGVTDNFEELTKKVEEKVVEKGGEGRFGTWTYSYGFTVSAGLAEHARNVIIGDSSLTDIKDLSKAYGVFSPGAEWNGSNYTDAETGSKYNNTFLIYQDTYILGNPGRYMGTTKIKVPEEYFTIK